MFPLDVIGSDVGKLLPVYTLYKLLGSGFVNLRIDADPDSETLCFLKNTEI